MKNDLRRWVIGLAAMVLWLPAGLLASELSDRLSGPNHVLLMRHAYAPGVGDPPGYDLSRCDTQRQLNAQGQAQAARIGDWLRQQGVTQARVLSSIWCRCQQTAERLNFGPVTIAPSLASFFSQPDQAAAQTRQLQQMIAQELARKGSQALILVTHHVNIRELIGRDIGSGDMVLVRVSPQGQALEHRLYPSP